MPSSDLANLVYLAYFAKTRRMLLQAGASDCAVHRAEREHSMKYHTYVAPLPTPW